jgi:signal transduction histidine kinase
MASYHDNDLSPDSTPASEAAQSELDLRLFHLKTLYDVSRELLGTADIRLILRNFLLMTLGNFGVAEGFIFMRDSASPDSGLMVTFGHQEDVLETLTNNLLVALKHARSAAALRAAYEEVSILNRAKDKLINHLAHELKTPVAVLLTSLKLIKKHLAPVPREKWQRVMHRAEKNLRRLLEMEDEVEDIIHKSESRVHQNLTRLLDQCADELETLIAEQIGDTAVVANIRDRIDQIFLPGEALSENIHLDQFVREQLLKMNPCFPHRNVELKIDMQPAASIYIPSEPLQKIFAGLLKNAIENTPDEGRIEIKVKNAQQNVELEIKDAGIGIIDEDQQHIFEGFFPTQEVSRYSSKTPFDFNAGGRGADLLRMKIFSERFNFKLDMQSTRCRHIPQRSDVCPGRISDCKFCRDFEDCYASGGTSFRALFPAW